MLQWHVEAGGRLVGDGSVLLPCRLATEIQFVRSVAGTLSSELAGHLADALLPPPYSLCAYLSKALAVLEK